MRIRNPFTRRTIIITVTLACIASSLASCKTDDEPDWSTISNSEKDTTNVTPDTPATLFYESFNQLKGLGGNDGYYDNDAGAGVEIAQEDLLDASDLDNKTGWGDFVKVAVCNQCVRLATKKNNGSLTTPAITLNGKQATLTFNAAAQLDDNVTLYVEASDGAQLTYNGTTASKISVHLPASEQGKTVLANQTYSIQLSQAGASCRITFSTISSTTDKQRVFIDEIKIETK